MRRTLDDKLTSSVTTLFIFVMAAKASTRRDRHAVISFTLPISCQICLGKVKQPVLCPNDHAFCSTCMDVWLARNQQCPTCRTPINESNPVKQIKGSLKDMEDCPEHMSNPSLRKARFDLLYQEYEKEFLRMEDELRFLRSENGVLKDQMVNTQEAGSGCEKHEFVRPSFSDSTALLALTRKLQDAQRLYDQLKQETARLKQENNNLKDKNVDLKRENQKLRLEISNRSPHRYGRYTVATLESKVGNYEREISQLKKALERSDKYVEDLEKQMSIEIGLSKVSKSHNVNILPSKSNPEIISENPAKRQLFGVIHDDGNSHEKDSTSSEIRDENKGATCEDQSILTWPNSVAQDKERSPKKVHFSLPNDSVESNSFILDNPSPFEPSESSRFGITSANKLVPKYQDHGCNKPIEGEKGYRLSSSLSHQNDNSDLDDTQTIRSELDDLNISLTPELSDCLKLLNRAEKRQHEEKEVLTCKNSGVGDITLFEAKNVDLQSDNNFSKRGNWLYAPFTTSKNTENSKVVTSSSHTHSDHGKKIDYLTNANNGSGNKNKCIDKTSLLARSSFDLGSDNIKAPETTFIPSMPITTIARSHEEPLRVAVSSSNRRASFDGGKYFDTYVASSLQNIPKSSCKYSSLTRIPSSVSSSVTSLSTHSQTISNLDKLNQLLPVPRSNKSMPSLSNVKLGPSNNLVLPLTGSSSTSASAAATTLSRNTSIYTIASATRPGQQLHTSNLSASDFTRYSLPDNYTLSTSQGLLTYTPSLYTIDGRDLSEDKRGNFSYVSTISNDLSSRGSDSFLTEPKKRLFESSDDLELTLSPIKSTRIK